MSDEWLPVGCIVSDEWLPVGCIVSGVSEVIQDCISG